MQLLIGNDQTLTVDGLQDELTGDFINDATVTVTLKTEAGILVSGQSWPLSLGYVTSSDGTYRGTIEDGIDLRDGRRYILEISATASDDLVGFWRDRILATYRTP